MFLLINLILQNMQILQNCKILLSQILQIMQSRKKTLILDNKGL